MDIKNAAFTVWQHSFVCNPAGGLNVYCTKTGALQAEGFKPSQNAVLKDELGVYLEFRKEYWRAKYEREMNEIFAELQDKRRTA